MKKKTARKMQHHTKAEPPKKKLSEVISTGSIGLAEEEERACPGCGMDKRECECENKEA